MGLFVVLFLFLVVDKLMQVVNPQIQIQNPIQVSVQPALPPTVFATTGYSLEYLAGRDGIDIVAHPGQLIEVLRLTSTGDSQFGFYGLDLQPEINWYIATGGIGRGQTVVQSLRISPSTKPGVYETTGQLVSQPLGGVKYIPIRVRIEN